MSKKSKTTSTSNTTQNVVSTPTNPEWVTNSVQGLQGRIDGLLNTDPASLVPGASPLQQQAFGAAGRLMGGSSGGSAQPAPTPGIIPGQGAPQLSGLGGGRPMASGPNGVPQPPGDMQPPGPAPAGQRWVHGPEGYVLMDERNGGSFRDAMGGLGMGKQPGGFAGTSPVETAAPAPMVGENWRQGNAAAQESAAGLLGAPMEAQTATAAGGVSPTLATSRSLLDVDLDGYMNPYLDSVVDTTLGGFDENAGMRRAELAAAQARGQKFSGSGSAIERSLFERGSGRDRAGIEAGLRSAGYDRATGLATGDLNREADTSRFNSGLSTSTALSEAGRFDNMGQFNAGQVNNMTAAERQAQLSAAGLLGDLSNSQAGNERADLGLLSDMGDKEREIERQKLGANPQLLALISALNAAQPYQLFRGQNTNATGTSTGTSATKESDPMGDTAKLVQAAAAAATAFSDRRLKEDIQTAGSDASGRRVVSYRYKGEPKHVRRIGHIAQEVQKTDPHAVRKIGKHLAIDYGLLSGVV